MVSPVLGICASCAGPVIAGAYSRLKKHRRVWTEVLACPKPETLNPKRMHLLRHGRLQLQPRLEADTGTEADCFQLPQTLGPRGPQTLLNPKP